MAKRFTDTGKWNKASFSDLNIKMKLVWVYLLDNCDHAGIWDVNTKLLSFQIGETVTLPEILLAFGDKIKALSPTKIWIPSFVEFQYGALNPGNRAHLSVIQRLDKEGASKVLTSPIQGAKDKDKDKDKDKEREFEGKPRLDFEALYRDYPRKQGKAAGLKICKREISSPDDYDALRRAISAYRDHLRATGTEKRFIKMFSTFMGEWRDWLDPDAGAAADFSPVDNSSICGIANV